MPLRPGRSMRMMVLASVLLPQPLSPTRPRHSPGVDSKVHIVHGRHRLLGRRRIRIVQQALLYGKAQAQPAHLQQGLLCVMCGFPQSSSSRQGPSAKWQRQVWPGPTSRSAGGWLKHTSCACAHRAGQTGSPRASRPDSAACPVMAESVLALAVYSSGSEANRPRVYGFCGGG